LPPRRSSSTIQGTSPVPPPDYLRPTVKLQFYLDSRTGLPHIDGHAVTESEVEEVLGGPGEDRLGEEGARVALGQTAAGRYLRVVYVPDPEPDSVFVITAYTLEGKALEAFKRRRRKKQRP
jgi:hypothetical protein